MYKLREMICEERGERKIHAVVGDNMQFIIFFYQKTCLKKTKTPKQTNNQKPPQQQLFTFSSVAVHGIIL